MEIQEKIQRLNEIMALELAGVLQYQQQSLLLQGISRKEYAGYFQDQSDACVGHSRQIGAWIAAMGGIPGIQPEKFKQSTDLDEMLEHDLEMEERTLAAYASMAGDAGDDMPLRVFMETLALDEQRSVFELRKILQQVRFTRVPGEVGLRAVSG